MVLSRRASEKGPKGQEQLYSEVEEEVIRLQLYFGVATRHSPWVRAKEWGKAGERY